MTAFVLIITACSETIKNVYQDVRSRYTAVIRKRNESTQENYLWCHRNNYPFDDAECRIVILQVSENNAGMLGIAKRFGYEMTRIPKLRGPDEDEIICVLSRDTWANHKATTTHLARRGELV